MLGFSIFLGEKMTEETIAYIRKMKAFGFNGIFSSLHIPEDDVSKYRERLSDLSSLTKELEMELMVDISGTALEKIGLSTKDPAAILATGITGLRMDYHIENDTIAALSKQMKIALNASTITEKDVTELKAYQANFEQMEAWHNYYPRPETGLAKESFIEKNKWLKTLGFSVMAFTPGDEKLRGPLFQQLPTLEKHRNQHPLAGAIELLQHCYVDDVYIGDPAISIQTMSQFQHYFQEDIMQLHILKTPETAYEALILGQHMNRLDDAEAVIRSADARFRERVTISPEPSLTRTKGSVTIDNELYGRYMGEIQITKKDLPSDEKVNVIAKVSTEDLSLIDWIGPGQHFQLVTNKKSNDKGMKS